MAYAKDNTKRKAAAKEVGTHSRDDIKACKELTKGIKANIAARPSYTNPVYLAYRLAKFMVTQDNIEWVNSNGKQHGKPYTIAGGQLAVGIIDTHNWETYRDGDKDYILENKEIMVDRNGKIQTLTLDQIPPQYVPLTLYLLGCPEWNEEGLDLNELQQEYGKTYFSQVIQTYLMIVQGQRELDLYVKGRTTDIFIMKQYGWKDVVTTITQREVITSEEATKMIIDLGKAKGLLIESTTNG